jgi:ribonuclease J
MLSKVPSAQDFWFVPLGGTGEIGMNVNLYGHNQSWLMIDCGITFDVPLDQSQDKLSGVQKHPVVTADLSFITNRRDSLCGLVLTHAHEDHLGAVVAMWHELKCPIYTTAFTAEVLRRKAYRAQLEYELPIVVVQSGDELDVGPFTLQWLATTHSIPEANALLITTAVARVLHTGDWKIDASPVVGEGFNRSLFTQLAKKNVMAMVCDSTNANRPGKSVSEKQCERGLGELVSKAEGRVVITCFASNVARLVTIAKIAKATKRYMCLLGPALENMVSIARATGHWPDDFSITPRRHIGYLPKHEVLIVATGSQGEPRSGLFKLSLNQHRDCDLEAGDTVIFSSIIIPGNEKSVKKLTDLLIERDINVVESSNSAHDIHASGHPNVEDLQLLFDWVKPKCIVPVHGEPEHLKACAEVAKGVGIQRQLVGLNGDLYSFAPKYSIKRAAIKAGRIII